MCDCGCLLPFLWLLLLPKGRRAQAAALMDADEEDAHCGSNASVAPKDLSRGGAKALQPPVDLAAFVNTRSVHG
jgi:hypothetical protein